MYSLRDIQKQLHDRDPETDLLLKKAFAFAENAHKDQQRLSGESHLSHLTTTAYYLAHIGMDAETVAAGLLHDTLEDTDVKLSELRSEFGRTVSFLVQGVTKLGTIKYDTKTRQAESLRKLLTATAKDIRVIIIKLYDRLHNMETNAYHVPERRLRKAVETLDVYVPIAERLGMGRLRRDLEDLAFEYVDPDASVHTRSIIDSFIQEKGVALASECKKIKRELDRKGLRTARIEMRRKGVWSLHQKLKRKGDSITDIYDILALRIIADTTTDCYAALGAVHGLYKPRPGEFKDYIAFSKPNGYSSLHTVILVPNIGSIEVQIRSSEMHAQAEYGIVAQLSHKELRNIPSRDVFKTRLFFGK